MAVCDSCKREMTNPDTVTCVTDPIEMGDKTYGQIPYAGPGRCHDCRVTAGGFHHPGCDDERCPACHGQLISCGCLS